MNRDMQQLRREAEAKGWRVEITGAGHLKWLPPNGGQMLISPSTPSDRRSFLNHLARMKRHGFTR